MSKKLTMLVITLLAFGCMAWAAEKSFKGVVSDDHCGTKHSAASAEAAQCVEKCVSGGGKYSLVVGDKQYQVEPQDKFKGMGGKAVTVKGTASGDTITATSVRAAAAGRKKSAKKA